MTQINYDKLQNKIARILKQQQEEDEKEARKEIRRTTNIFALKEKVNI